MSYSWVWFRCDKCGEVYKRAPMAKFCTRRNCHGRLARCPPPSPEPSDAEYIKAIEREYRGMME